jgi:hypothetical protein
MNLAYFTSGHSRSLRNRRSEAAGTSLAGSVSILCSAGLMVRLVTTFRMLSVVAILPNRRYVR